MKWSEVVCWGGVGADPWVDWEGCLYNGWSSSIIRALMPLLVVVPLFLVGIFGAWLAKGISGGALPWWLPILPSLGTGLLWGWVSRVSSDLSVATVVFDVVYTGAFLAGFLLLGDRLSVLQSCGILLAMVGVALMSV